MNEVNLIGNIGSVLYDNQKEEKESCIMFSMATSKKWKDKAGNENVKTQWHKVVVNGTLSYYLRPSLVTGKRVFVRGELQYNQYKDKNGIDKESAQIQVNVIQVFNQ